MLLIALIMLEAHQQAWQLCLAHGSLRPISRLGSYASPMAVMPRWMSSCALHGAEVLLN